MKGFIWPSKNKKNGTVSKRSSSVSGSTQTSKTTTSNGKQSSSSGSTILLGKKSTANDTNNSSAIGASPMKGISASGTGTGATISNGSASTHSVKRKNSSAFSSRKQSIENLSRSSVNIYSNDAHNMSTKSIGSSLNRYDNSSVDSEPVEHSPEREHNMNRSTTSENETLVRDSTYTTGISLGAQSELDNNEEISMEATTKYESRSTNGSMAAINSENYDNLTLKEGWVNRSHGTIVVSQPLQSSHSNNDNHLSSKNSHRDSKFFGSETAESTIESQVIIPDYKLYRAQLKGPILNLYKSFLPANVKCFDPLLAGKAEPAIRVSSVKGGNNIPKSSKSISGIKYLNETYPHPDLKLDENGKVLSGTIESLCHTVLFSYPNEHDSKCEKNIINLLLILPLIDNFVKFLQMFNQFGLTFTKHSSKVSNNSIQYYNISPNMDILMTERLGLTVKVILDIFPGFLLDDSVFQVTVKLLDTVSLHNDEISNNLKFYVADKHNQLSGLVAFSRPTPSKHRNNEPSVKKDSRNVANTSNSDSLEAANIPTSHHNSIKNNRLLDSIISVEQFLMMDTKKLADEVHSINLKFDKKWAPRFDYSLLYDSKFINNDIVALNPLVFNNNYNVHFLGRLLICHLFPTNRTSVMNPKVRAKVLTKWIEFGGMFEKLGDMVSWLAIATIICSVPILRLSASWKYVPDQIIKVLFRDWIPTIAQLDRRQMSLKSTSSVFILAPPNLDDPFVRANVISYFGDLIIHADNLPSSSKFKYLEKKINRTKNAFFKWEQRLESLSTRPDNSSSYVINVSPESSKIYQFWRYHLNQHAINIETIMQISLRNEPPRIDQSAYSIIGSQRSPLSSGGYLPVLFNNLLPTYSLFSRGSLIAASGSSTHENDKDTTARSRSSFRQTKAPVGTEQFVSSDSCNHLHNVEESQITGLSNIDAPLVKELSLKQSNRQRMLKCIRDAFNIDSDIFRVSDNLIFKSLTDAEVRSPTTSIVIETPKRFSQQSSNNGTLQGPQDSNDSSNRLSKTLENMDFFKSIGQASESLNQSLIHVVLKSGSLERIFDLLVLTASVFSKFIDNKDLERYYHHKRQREQSQFDKSKGLDADDGIGLLDYAFVKLTMDMDTFTKTFFNSYKSFTTTTHVLEQIARRYVGAKTCAFSISQILDSNDIKVKGLSSSISEYKFPVWDFKLSENAEVNPSFWLKIQIGAAEALLSLVKAHYSDFTDDLAANSTLLDILKIMEQDVSIVWPNKITDFQKAYSKTEMKEIESHISSLIELFNDIKCTYQKQLYRPLGVSKNSRKVTALLSSFKTVSLMDYSTLFQTGTMNESMIHQFRDLKHNTYEKILKWINSLDKFISEKNLFVTPQDWFATYQILESISHDSLTALFSFPLRSISHNIITSGTSQLDELTILDVYTWLMTLTVKTEQVEVLCLEKLPESIQLLIKIHKSLTSFLQIEISDSRKSIDERIETCTVILQILNFVRWKNSSLDLFEVEENANPDTISPHIPSFIETAITSAILSPKSRFFEHAWDAAHEKLRSPNISGKFSSVCNILDDLNDDHIKSFLQVDDTFMTDPKNLCPCPGWVVSRLLEISQFVPNMSIMNSKLINFDKRRFVNNIISNALDLVPLSTHLPERDESSFRRCLFFNFTDPSMTFRKAARLKSQSEIKTLKYQVRGIFNEILIKEVEKIKRDHKKVETLIVQERDNKRSIILQQVMQKKNRSSTMITASQNNSNSLQTSNKMSSAASSSWSSPREKRSSVASFTGRNSSTSNVNHHHMSKKLGGFFKRPFSIGGFNSSASTSSLSSILVPDVQEDGTVSPHNLPSVDSLSFQDQKPSYSLKTFEIKNILEVINHRKVQGYSYCFKILRLDGSEFILQATSAADMAEWIKMIKLSKRYSFHSRRYKGKTHNKIFGVPLEDVCERENTVIPSIVVKLLEEIELRGLDEVGLYRIPGSVGSVNALKNAFDEEGAVNNTFTLEDERWFEINAIAGCFKMYLRELPDCLFSNEKVTEFSNLSLKFKSSQISFDDYKKGITDLLRSLPACYYQTMKRIVFHLNKVHQHVENNRMDASNLAIVFSMSFMDQDDLASSMGATLGAVQSILQQFITAPEVYFD